MHLIFKNILHFWKAHLIVILSLALACALILAALILGDSLSKTLEDKAITRLSKVSTYVEKVGSYANLDIATDSISSLLAIDAIATAKGQSRAVKLYVVDDNFWSLSLNSTVQNLGDGVGINNTLVQALSLTKDSQIALRFALKNSASAEIALSDSTPNVLSSSFNISKILDAEDFANFYLYDWQNSPPNIFISQKVFYEKFQIKKSANLFLSAKDEIKDGFCPSFESLGLSCNVLAGKHIVKSENVFIADEIVAQMPSAIKTLSWFVSKIDMAKASDYNAFIIGAGDNLALDEVEINELYAKEHSLKVGDFLTLNYYVFDENLRQKFLSTKLKVAKILPINTGYFFKDFVPEYEGLTNVDDCTKWKSSIDIDLKKITDSHKNYWSNYGATPKFRVSYELSLQMFSGSLGKATALVLDEDISSLDFSNTNLEKLGFLENHPKQNYLENAQNGVDFKGLFIGLSFFIIINALLLIALIFRMNLTGRFAEIRLLKHLGFRAKYIENFYFKEYFLSIVLGGVLGLFFGVGFAKILLFLLNSIWGDISDGAEIFFSAKISSIFIAFMLSVALGFIVLKIFTRRFFRAFRIERFRDNQSSKIGIFLSGFAFSFCIIFAFFCNLNISTKALLSVLAYILGVYFSVALFRKLARCSNDFSALAFVKTGIASRLSKSVYVLLSLGVYLLCVVGLNEIDSTKTASEYEYVVKTFIGAKVPEQDSFKLLPLSVKEGAMANCLNLNKISQAQVLGANISDLESANVISIKSIFEGDIAEKVVKAYVDESSLLWVLKASLGDEFEYDTQIGKVKLKLVGTLNPSIFQGSFIIDQDDFKRLFGSDTAYNIFLAKPENGASSGELSAIFSPYLPDIKTAKSILASFDSLQNAYLNIFYQLGVIGLALGIFGSLVAIRNALLIEQENLKMLHLVGLRKSLVSSLITAQYLLMNLSASLVGIVASLPLIKLEGNYLKALIVFSLVIVLNLFLYPILKLLLSTSTQKKGS